jgi:hypothetical protein
MKKLYVIFTCLAIIVAGAILAIYNQERYEISPELTSEVENPILGVSINIEADRRGGTIKIINESDHYIVIEPSRKPVHIDIYLDDGWHRLVSHKIWQTEAPAAIPEHSEYELDFRWFDIFGSSLKKGEYRATFFYGDGEVKTYDFFSSMIEFSID